MKPMKFFKSAKDHFLEKKHLEKSKKSRKNSNILIFAIFFLFFITCGTNQLTEVH